MVQRYASTVTKVNENQRQQAVSGKCNIDIIERHKSFPFLLGLSYLHKNVFHFILILSNDTKVKSMFQQLK